MAKHTLSLSVPSLLVGRTDIQLEVKSGSTLLGRLQVSQGTVDWWPSRSKRKHYSLTWEQFAKLMEAEGTPYA